MSCPTYTAHILLPITRPVSSSPGPPSLHLTPHRYDLSALEEDVPDFNPFDPKKGGAKVGCCNRHRATRGCAYVCGPLEPARPAILLPAWHPTLYLPLAQGALACLAARCTVTMLNT